MSEEKKKKIKNFVIRHFGRILLAVAVVGAFLGFAYFANQSIQEALRLKYKVTVSFEIPEKYKEATHISVEIYGKRIFFFSPINRSSITFDVYLTVEIDEEPLYIAYYKSMGNGSFIKLGEEKYWLYLKGIPLKEVDFGS